ncbi:lipoprotein insertase outer membrane protein LolB [Photobacterium ganghwense]|uniref:lipoprotein insertase outer membrane protein LolB n=1 Tax=Photobacterium ganghwense TaxID=320778 RepID=UPI000D15B5D1|nr:lipoprotein insertase outer membrane protein LolB [Photobacterium ganghwense]MBV1842683.1 lipoprotein insertase outer membrane protein LolB [Photobacterium ganghwense]PSU05721.1 outer membrane lipoprotein LolB [Photobacterium ganghwense]QSV14731.1 outer membrane lipoprotein LolB [Photobacterium ganghwense]
MLSTLELRHWHLSVPVRRTTVLFFLFAFLSGCATSPTTDHKTSWESHEQALTKLTHYQAAGKLGYKGSQRFSANMHWETRPREDKLLLTNFLGSTLLKLNATPSSVTLVNNEGKTFQGRDAGKLVEQLTGLNLPVTQMRDWLIGLPTAADTYQLNKEGRVSYLAKEIDGKLWQLDYNEYDYSVTPALPKRLVLSTTGVTITLVINNWSTN